MEGKQNNIIEIGFFSLGRMLQNFLELSAFTAPSGQRLSLRTGQFITGPTEWSDVWQRRFLLKIFSGGGQCGRRFWVDMCLVSALPLSVLLCWGTVLAVVLLLYWAEFRGKVYICNDWSGYE